MLGEREKIIKLTSKRYILESFVLEILLIMGLYHLIFYFIHKDDATFLIFGLFCILMAFRVICTGELIIKELFPFIGWIMMRKIEFFIFYVIVPMFLVFLYSLYPKEVKKRDVILIGSFGLFFGIVVLATQNGTYTKLVDFYQIITISVSSYCFFILLKAFFHKKEGALIIIFGGIILFFTVVNDILFNRGIIKSTNLFPLGIVFFIMFYSYVLALKFKRIREEVEKNIKKAESEKQQKETLIKLKEINERSLNKLKLIQQFSSIIYKEKDLKKVIYCIMNILILYMGFDYKKGMYLCYDDESDCLILKKIIDYDGEKKELDSDMIDIIQKIKNNFAKKNKNIEEIKIEVSKSELFLDVIKNRKYFFKILKNENDNEIQKINFTNIIWLILGEL